MPALPLSPAQLEDAARLHRLFKAWQSDQKARGRPSSQLAVAPLFGFGQSALSQYLNGRIPLNIEALLKFAEVLDCHPADISPLLASEIESISAAAGGGVEIAHMPVRMVDAKASAGAGHVVFSGDVKKILMFRRDWLRQKGVRSEEDVLAFEVDGDSMVDEHIVSGAVVLANCRQREASSDGLYVVCIDGYLFVKKLVQYDGQWWARSCNKARAKDYPDIAITSSDDRIVGKAFWCGFGL